MSAPKALSKPIDRTHNQDQVGQTALAKDANSIAKESWAAAALSATHRYVRNPGQG